jgi:toxin ParE1/3/4
MSEYRLTPAAERDLEDIWTYTLKNWGLEQANHYIDRLMVVFDALSQSPKTAPACDHILLGYRRRSFERHMVYFRITNYGIEVVRILHVNMDALSRL